ncbi:hypothetical protein AAVH_05958 [Aphelenchoides avenae]|nr:hypothetical protein AAVH_05958 [Aphelenchus avenae]
MEDAANKMMKSTNARNAAEYVNAARRQKVILKMKKVPHLFNAFLRMTHNMNQANAASARRDANVEFVSNLLADSKL